MAEHMPMHDLPDLPHGWDQWAGLFGIVGAIGTLYLWWRNRIYWKGRRDQRREDEAAELRKFREYVERRLGEPVGHAAERPRAADRE